MGGGRKQRETGLASSYEWAWWLSNAMPAYIGSQCWESADGMKCRLVGRGYFSAVGVGRNRKCVCVGGVGCSTIHRLLCVVVVRAAMCGGCCCRCVVVWLIRT